MLKLRTLWFAFIAVLFVSGCPNKKIPLNLHSWLQPVPANSKFIDKDYFIWGASMVEGDDGKFHLFYSRWKREYGHNAWVSHSEIAYAIADSPAGPYVHKDVVLPPRGKKYWDGLSTHNPTVHKFDGKYYLYYMGNTGDGAVSHELNWVHRNNQRIGVAVSDFPQGPWERQEVPLIDVSKQANSPDSLMVSNPTVTQMQDGKFLMIYKAVTSQGPAPFGGPVVHLAATAESPEGPFVKRMTPLFVKQGEKFPAEDPFIWREGNTYYAIVKDFNGVFTQAGQSLALFQSSDGFDWAPSTHTLVSQIKVNWLEGGEQRLMHLERPQLWLKDGKPAILFVAADENREHSFNLHVPLEAPDN